MSDMAGKAAQVAVERSGRLPRYNADQLRKGAWPRKTNLRGFYVSLGRGRSLYVLNSQLPLPMAPHFFLLNSSFNLFVASSFFLFTYLRFLLLNFLLASAMTSDIWSPITLPQRLWRFALLIGTSFG
jgi:hypothetical protein